MSVGFPQTAAEVNARSGQLALTLRDTFTQVQNFKAFLDSVTDTQLGAAPFSFATGDISVLRSSFVDLDKLRTVYQGTATQATTYDFRTFAHLLTGAL